MTFVVWFISSLPYLPQILSNLRVKLSSKGIHVQIFAIFWKLKCLMFVSSIISESSNVRTMYLFAYIRMFGCSTFVCSQDPDCLDVLMFVHEQMFNIRGWRWNLTKSIWKMRLSHGLICIRFRNLTNSNQCQIINLFLYPWLISEGHRKSTVMKVYSRSFSVVPTHSMTSSSLDGELFV